ncbi:MAG: signal peptidase II [Candidatus Moranbacteria bacterium]|jgi:lipoprotein signal peptidase|nr:signal peptidase II [Candidatus Moranbacteria bacterium]MBP9801268.1 signal peptidase II [Candidatus Moranbacteria bacterium]
MKRVMSGRRCSAASLFLFCGLVFIDQGSKYIVSGVFPHGMICNTGGSWGMAIPLPVLIGMTIGILVWMISIQWKQRKYRQALIFIIAGGVGNLWDRVAHGCVTDFISLPYFPLFNGADIFLSIGCMLLFWSWRDSKMRIITK